MQYAAILIECQKNVNEQMLTQLNTLAQTCMELTFAMPCSGLHAAILLRFFISFKQRQNFIAHKTVNQLEFIIRITY